MLKKENKLNALTGLRAIAAAMILIEHASVFKIPGATSGRLDHGVSFFFVLSGFILAYVYPRFDGAKDVAKFFAARISRIWPAYLVSLLLAAVALRMPANQFLLPNIFMVQGWIPSWPYYFSYNAPSWSVSTEMFFYLAFPALIFRWERTWLWKWLAAGALVIFLIWLVGEMHLPRLSMSNEATQHGVLYINPLARIFEFVSGMVACLAYRRLRTSMRELPKIYLSILEVMISIIAVASICDGLSFSMFPHFMRTAGAQWTSKSSDVLIFPVLIFLFAFGEGSLSKLLGSRLMILLGEISFSVYLTHQTVFYYYVKRWPSQSTDYTGFTICVLTTLLLSLCIWTMIEMPFRNAVKSWLNSRSHSAAPVYIQERTGADIRQQLES